MNTNRALILASLCVPALVAWSPLDPAREALADATTPAANSGSADVEPVVANVQRVLDGVVDFSGQFVQTAYQVALGESRTSRGDVVFRRPGKMLWDYAGGSGQMGRILLLDGASLWSIDLEQEQYYSAPLDNAGIPVAMKFLTGDGDLSEDFDVTISARTQSEIRLHLIPKTPTGDYVSLDLRVDPSSWHIAATTFTDALGNTNTIEFREMTYNVGVEDHVFVAEIPAGFTRIQVPEGP